MCVCVGWCVGVWVWVVCVGDVGGGVGVGVCGWCVWVVWVVCVGGCVCGWVGGWVVCVGG